MVFVSPDYCQTQFQKMILQSVLLVEVIFSEAPFYKMNTHCIYLDPRSFLYKTLEMYDKRYETWNNQSVAALQCINDSNDIPFQLLNRY